MLSPIADSNTQSETQTKIIADQEEAKQSLKIDSDEDEMDSQMSEFSREMERVKWCIQEYLKGCHLTFWSFDNI